MSSEFVIWASNDGSYGSDPVYNAITNFWSKQQWDWFHELANTDEVFADELMDIDNGTMPERLKKE